MSLRQRREAYAAEREQYGIDVPIPGLQSVDRGTNLLVAGPAMIGKERLAMELIAAGFDEEPAVLLSPDRAAKRVFDEFERVVEDAEAVPLYVVDCSGTGTSAFRDTSRVKYVADPGDLTGVGIGMVKCTRDVGDAARNGLRLGLISVSTLLQHTEPDRVFNFLHVLTGRIAAAGYLGICTFDPAVHDEQVASAVRSQFDRVLELRESDEGREIRAVGFPDVDRKWHQF